MAAGSDPPARPASLCLPVRTIAWLFASRASVPLVPRTRPRGSWMGPSTPRDRTVSGRPASHHEEANGTKIGRASFDQPFLMEMPHLAAANLRRPYTPPWFPTHRRGFERVSSIAAMVANRLFAYLGAGAINTPARTTFAHDPMSTRFGNALVNIISPRCPTVPPSRPQASPDLSCTITSTTLHASAAAFFVPWRSSVKAPRPPH